MSAVIVNASLLALRVTPAGPISHWLRINTAVELLEESGEHCRVQLAEPSAEGWVDCTYLGAEPISPQQAARRFRAAAQAGDARTEQIWRARFAAMVVAEAPREAELAVCEEGAVVYLGRLVGGSFVAQHIPTGDAAQLVALSGHHWGRCDPAGFSLLEGSPFAAPSLQAFLRAERTQAPTTCTESSCVSYRITLGACAEEGAVYSTGPICSLREAPRLQGSGWGLDRAVKSVMPAVPDERWLLDIEREVALVQTTSPAASGWSVIVVAVDSVSVTNVPTTSDWD